MPLDQSVRTDRPAGFIGSLADTPLAEVFRRIVSEERSGDLQVTTPEAIKTVYFDRGFIVFASSNRKSDRLGESMIEAGRISRSEFAAASDVMKASRLKFGKALVSSGIVSEEELGHYVAAQVNRIVLSLFAASRGMYSFDERPTIIPVDLMVSLSVYRILMEGIRHMPSKKLVLAGLPSLDTEVEVVDRPPFALDVGGLRPVERSVLKAIHGLAKMRTVVDEVGGDEGVALRALYGLIAAGVLETKAEQVKPPPSPQLETGTFVLSEISQTVSESEPAPAGILGRLKGVWTSAAEWLGIPGGAPSDLGIAPSPPRRRPRPAAAPQIETPVEVPVEAPVEAKVEVPAEGNLEIEEPVEAPSPKTSLSPVADGARVPEWSLTDRPSDQFRDFFEEQGVSMSSKLENVPPEPRPEAALSPSSEQAVGWKTLLVTDPDLVVELPREEDVPSMLAQIPIEEVAVNEEAIAFDLEEEIEIEVETAKAASVPEPEPAVTMAAESSVAADESASRAREQARRRIERIEQGGGESRLLRDVKLHFKLRDWEGAVPLLEQLIEICPGKAVYRGMMGRALSRLSSRRKEAEAHFIEALRLSPHDAEIHYWLGLYYKSFGLHSRALHEFKMTLRIQPRHEGARQQLGASAKQDDAFGSVIKKFFG
ncbi:MAG TPA: DUF4388 domain-containing protein [Vicinamibacteria bacterium]|nr:DUF4388 domain-containing protein [Vicinamibacteria bacterium]